MGIEIKPGTRLADAAFELCELRKIVNIDLKTAFNGCPLCVTETTRYEDIMKMRKRFLKELPWMGSNGLAE